MLKKLLVMSTLCAVILSTGFLGSVASARTTKDKYDTSGIFVITMKDNVVMYAEPNAASLTLGTYKKGTMFVPINQSKNAQEGTLYNLVVRADGAVGWILADSVAITHK